MKAILVIDMPDSCDEDKCPLCYDGAICTYTGRRIIEGWGKPNSCPLRPLPKHKYGFEADGLKPSNQILIQSGWNDCLDEITGETE